MLLTIHAVTHTLVADTGQAAAAAVGAAGAGCGRRAACRAAHNGAVQTVPQRDREAACASRWRAAHMQIV
jgi:hypothetical protein